LEVFIVKEVLNISGMACPACARGIEKTLLELKGVTKASVDFDRGELSLEYDERYLPEYAVRDIVAGIVHDVVEDTGRASYSVQVFGLKCPECARNIEENLESREGVVTASVNFARKRAHITYDPRIIEISRVRNMLGDAACDTREHPRAKGQSACGCREVPYE
jgi:Cd2+/Zn2+-exporting ATPase